MDYIILYAKDAPIVVKQGQSLKNKVTIAFRPDLMNRATGHIVWKRIRDAIRELHPNEILMNAKSIPVFVEPSCKRVRPIAVEKTTIVVKQPVSSKKSEHFRNLNIQQMEWLDSEKMEVRIKDGIIGCTINAGGVKPKVDVRNECEDVQIILNADKSCYDDLETWEVSPSNQTSFSLHNCTGKNIAIRSLALLKSAQEKDPESLKIFSEMWRRVPKRFIGRPQALEKYLSVDTKSIGLAHFTYSAYQMLEQDMAEHPETHALLMDRMTAESR